MFTFADQFDRISMKERGLVFFKSKYERNDIYVKFWTKAQAAQE